MGVAVLVNSDASKKVALFLATSINQSDENLELFFFAEVWWNCPEIAFDFVCDAHFVLHRLTV